MRAFIDDQSFLSTTQSRPVDRLETVRERLGRVSIEPSPLIERDALTTEDNILSL